MVVTRGRLVLGGHRTPRRRRCLYSFDDDPSNSGLAAILDSRAGLFRRLARACRPLGQPDLAEGEGRESVTVSVTVRSERDDQDTTRRPPVIIRYLAANVEFARKIQKERTGRWRFSRPPPSTTRPSLRVEFAPEFERLSKTEPRARLCVTGCLTVVTVRDNVRRVVVTGSATAARPVDTAILALRVAETPETQVEMPSPME